MLLISYTYICSSKTTINRFLLSRTASTLVGKVSSHIVDCLLVFVIRSCRGDRITATKDVENSISMMAISLPLCS